MTVDNPDRRSAGWIIPVGLGILTFLLLFLLRTASQSGDSLSYSASVLTGARMFHPHHLLFVPAIRSAYLLVGAFCPTCDVILAAQIHNIGWAVVTILVMFRVVERLSASTWAGVAAAILFLSFQGFAYYSTQVEVYVPSTACMALVLWVLVRNGTNPLGAGAQALVALAFALAVFYHQANVLFCVPLAGYLVCGHGRRGLAITVRILGATGILVLSAYVVAFIGLEREHTLAEFLNYCLSYAVVPNPGWGTMSNVGPTGLRELAYSQVWNVAALPVEIPSLMKFFSVAALLLLGWQAWMIARRADETPLRVFLLVWLGVYYGFFLWWLPSEREFFVTPLVPLALIVTLTVLDVCRRVSRRPVASRVLAGGALLVAVGLYFLNLPVAWAAHRSRGDAYDVARAMHEQVPQDGYVLLADFYTRKHLEYYFGRAHTERERLPGFQYYRRQLEHPTPELVVLGRTGLCIRLSVVDPACKYDEADGYLDARQWFRFMHWLFDFKERDDVRAASCRQFDLKLDDRGEALLLMHVARRPVRGMRDLFEELDQRILEIPAAGTPPFMNWWDRFRTGH